MWKLAMCITCLVGFVAFDGVAYSQDLPFVSSPAPLRILSANDGERSVRLTDEGLFDSSKLTRDSITVIDLSADQPPKSRTVYGTVPNTIIGSPHLAISKDGRLGFVVNHSWRMDDPTDSSTKYSELPPDRQNSLFVIDLDSPKLEVIQTVRFQREPWMVDQLPDGRIIVGCSDGFYVYEVGASGLTQQSVNPSPIHITSFDVSPLGDRIVVTGMSNYSKDLPLDKLTLGIHLFSIMGERVGYLHEVKIDEVLGTIDGPFSPRFSPDGKRVLVLNGLGFSGKGQLDDVLSIDTSLAQPKVTAVVKQVADGLESIAFHPNNRMAVITCLGENHFSATPGFGRLAVLDLTTRPLRLLYQTPVEVLPEGIEFSPDGKLLFVGCTYAHHIAVFNVSGFMMRRSPFVLPTGHGHSSLAISARVRQ